MENLDDAPEGSGGEGFRAPDGAAPADPPVLVAPSAEPEQPAPAISASAEAFVRAWFNDHFPGSHVARDTRAFAVAHDAARDLMARLTVMGVK